MAITRSLIMRSITGLALCTMLAILYMYLPPLFLSVLFATLLGIILVIEWSRLCAHQPLLWYLTPLYPVTPFILLIALNQQPAYHHLVFFIFLVVFSHDTGSYIAGNLIGNHRICPTISPGKTWEGFLGGCIGVFGITMLVFERPSTTTAYLVYLVLLFALCCISLGGDLFESLLKRNAGLKDSGSLLPGHGGLLDRFDSVMFVTVAVYVLKNYLMI